MNSYCLRGSCTVDSSLMVIQIYIIFNLDPGIDNLTRTAPDTAMTKAVMKYLE
jgi:hypothetical protein